MMPCRADKDVDGTHSPAGLPPEVDVDRSLSRQAGHAHRHGPRVPLRQPFPRGGRHRSAADDESARGARHRRVTAGEAGAHG